MEIVVSIVSAVAREVWRAIILVASSMIIPHRESSFLFIFILNRLLLLWKSLSLFLTRRLRCVMC